METTEERWIIFFGEWLEWDLDAQLEAPQIIFWKIPDPDPFPQEYPLPACPICGGEFAHSIGCPES